MVDAQLRTLRIYGALCTLRDEWGGALVVACSEDASLVASAVGIAGGRVSGSLRRCRVIEGCATARRGGLRSEHAG